MITSDYITIVNTIDRLTKVRHEYKALYRILTKRGRIEYSLSTSTHSISVQNASYKLYITAQLASNTEITYKELL